MEEIFMESKKDIIISGGEDKENIELIDGILEIERRSFPVGWQYDGAKEYFSSVLGNKININVFVFDSGKVVGYALLVPLGDVYKEIKEFDGEIVQLDNTAYLETIGILPEYQGLGLSRKMLIDLNLKAKKAGYNKIAVHARILNGFNKIIRKSFSQNIFISHLLEKWKYGGNEPYEFMVWNII
jgi:GNAT superfamily N-acetyltransferase